MRIAVLVIGLLIGLMLVLQSFAIGILGGTTLVDDVTYTAGAAGVLMALGWLLASALVIPFPLVSTIIFGLTALLGLSVPAGLFGDLRFHGVVALVLTVMSFFGWREKKKSDREKADEKLRQQYQDARMLQLMTLRAQAPRSPASDMCDSCGSGNPPGSRFCGSCGTSMSPALISAPQQMVP